MIPRSLVALMAALFGSNCAPRIDDLRLDAVRPPQIGHLGRDTEAAQPRSLMPIIVVELSTTRDLRSLTVNHASGSYVDVVLCRGRTGTSRREARFDIVASRGWYETAEPAGALQHWSDRHGPVAGRYRYSVPIVLRQAGGAYSGGGLGERSFAEINLMRTPVDLCLVVDTSNFGPQWRSNTVVIPADAIRAAITAAMPR